MEPVVGGLEAEYGDRIEFRTLNANIGEGQAAFRAYRLGGHPSYVLLNSLGEISWKALGPLTAVEISTALEAAFVLPSE